MIHGDKGRIFANILNIFLIIIILLIIAAVFASIFPISVLEFTEEKFPIKTGVIYPGEQVIFEAKFYKKYNISVVIYRQLMNDRIYNYSPIGGNLPQGINQRLVTVEIPNYVEPGTYFIRTTYEFKVNIFNTVTQIIDTELFEIINKEGE